MRTYLILKEKAKRFHEDPEIAQALEVARQSAIFELTSPEGLSAKGLQAVRAEAAASSEEKLAAVGYGHERLDQLVNELLLGVR